MRPTHATTDETQCLAVGGCWDDSGVCGAMQNDTSSSSVKFTVISLPPFTWGECKVAVDPSDKSKSGPVVFSIPADHPDVELSSSFAKIELSNTDGNI